MIQIVIRGLSMLKFNRVEPYDFNFLYNLIESNRFQISPLRHAIKMSLEWLHHEANPFQHTEFGRRSKATLEIFERVTRVYAKPQFNIHQVEIDGKIVAVNQTTVRHKPFCNLLHFKKDNYLNYQPKLLIVAPMAGHHATLLRHTVECLLKYFDIYITDWIDASQVPLAQGNFDMDDNINYIIEFIELLGKETHVLAVCQPTVPTLSAVAIMSAERNPAVPKSIILMGGPVDARKSPTAVNSFATDRSIDWFKNCVISKVPFNYPGFMRPVYPGFLQVAGFISMNIDRHINSHIELYEHLVCEEDDKAQHQIKFYDEYFAVMDLPAEFYLQTIEQVFLKFALAKGELISRGRKVDLSAITRPALFGIEGERDDISGLGQTEAALNLCSNIPQKHKHYYMQKDVGHYGVFSGSKFKQFIVPEIKKFIDKHDKP